MNRAALFILALALTGGCAARHDTTPAVPPSVNYNSTSLLLKPGMTEKQVIDIAGQPTKSELSTCGQHLGKPWSCKSLVYYGQGAFSSQMSVWSGQRDS